MGDSVKRYRRILVTGSREWDDPATIATVLGRLWHPETTLVHGGAEGADTLADAYWTSRGGIPPEAHEAKWREFGRAAGVIRNQRMVDLGADLCVAFLRGNSTGTADCLACARTAGIPTEIYPYTTGTSACE